MLGLRLLAVVIASMTFGCTHVAPYERGRLAHPTMAGDVFGGPASEHVRAVQEGATGGGAISESGCGCN